MKQKQRISNLEAEVSELKKTVEILSWKKNSSEFVLCPGLRSAVYSETNIMTKEKRNVCTECGILGKEHYEQCPKTK